jgi:hypothetical protein
MRFVILNISIEVRHAIIHVILMSFACSQPYLLIQIKDWIICLGYVRDYSAESVPNTHFYLIEYDLPPCGLFHHP